MLYNFTPSWRQGEAVDQRRRKVREISKPSRTSERSMSDPDEMAHELTSHLQEIAYELGLVLRSQTDYANLLRKVVRAGRRIASWNPEAFEGMASDFLEVAYNTAKQEDVQVDDVMLAFAVNHQLLLMLGLVYDFFEDSRVERIDELTAEFEELSLELAAEYKKDPYAVLRPELVNKASALLGRILSVIRGGNR
jgi:hypothetical protein